MRIDETWLYIKWWMIVKVFKQLTHSKHQWCDDRVPQIFLHLESWDVKLLSEKWEPITIPANVLLPRDDIQDIRQRVIACRKKQDRFSPDRQVRTRAQSPYRPATTRAVKISMVIGVWWVRWPINPSHTVGNYCQICLMVLLQNHPNFGPVTALNH